MPQQGAQPVPSLEMDPIVGLVAVVRFEVHGNSTISRYAKTVNQLLEIQAAVLVVPPLELNGLGVLTVIPAAHRDTGGVVVDLIHLEIKTLHDRQHDARLQGGAIGRKQPLEGASQLVVADLGLRHQSCIVECDPFPDRIECVAIDQDVLDQGEQRLGVARVLQCQRQLVREPHARDELVQNR